MTADDRNVVADHPDLHGYTLRDLLDGDDHPLLDRATRDLLLERVLHPNEPDWPASGAGCGAC